MSASPKPVQQAPAQRVEPASPAVVSVYLQCQVQLLYRRLILAGEIQHIAEQEVSIAVRRGALHMRCERCQVLIEVRSFPVQITQVHVLFAPVRHTIHPSAYCVNRIPKIPNREMGQTKVELGHTVLRCSQDGLEANGVLTGLEAVEVALWRTCAGPRSTVRHIVCCPLAGRALHPSDLTVLFRNRVA